MIKSLVIPIFLAVCSAAAQSSAIKTLHTPDEGILPQAAVDPKGVVHLIYFKGDPKGGDIFYVRRQPGQPHFSKPIQVNRQPNTAMAMGTIRGAQLAIGKNGRVHVAWDGMGAGARPASHPSHNHDLSNHGPAGHGPAAPTRPKHEPGESSPLFYTRLNDTGTSFEPERNVITYAYGLDGGSSVAADSQGNVYVTWHAPQPGNTNGEAGRAVFVARSTNEGKTFQREIQATPKRTGVCACCGMKAFADSQGNVLALYRSAYFSTNRDETLLLSRNAGKSFDVAYTHSWNIDSCPMSSAFLSENSGEILAAAETHGRVFFIRLNPETGKASSPVSPEAKAKHPVAIGNSPGIVLLAWAEGTAWGKGGAVAWRLYDRNGKPTSDEGRAEGLKPWSTPTAFVEPDDSFTIIY